MAFAADQRQIPCSNSRDHTGLTPDAANVAPRLASALADRYRIERELGQGGMATV